MSIEVTTRSFPPGSGVANATVQAPCSRAELIAFTLTAGRPWVLAGGIVGWGGWGPSPTDPGAFAANEALELGGLALLLASYLEQPAGGSISATEYLHLLEPTEKSQAAARLGNGITRFLAWHVLGVPALHHVADAPVGVLVPVPGAASQRPDFFGRTGPGANYSTFESKGTTGPSNTPHRVDAKAQAQAFTTIAGSPVEYCTACFGRFRAAPAAIKATMIDPPPPTDGDDLGDGLLGRRELDRYGPIGRAMAAGRPRVVLPSANGTERPITLFRMGAAGYFGAVDRITDEIAGLLDDDAPARSADEAGRELERASAEVTDIRLPAVRPESPGETRRGHGGEAGSGSRLVEVEGHICELAVLPDGLVIALRREAVEA